MTVDESKTQLAALPEAQQAQIAAFLVHLRHQRDPAFRGDLTRRIDDRAPDSWITPAELREHWKE